MQKKAISQQKCLKEAFGWEIIFHFLNLRLKILVIDKRKVAMIK